MGERCFILCAIATLLCFSTSTPTEDSVYIIFYKDGSNITTYAAAPVLPAEYAAEHCNHGVWVVYAGTHYTTGVEGWFGVMSYDLVCGDGWIPGFQVRSARPVGITSNSSIPSVTFYTDVHYHGENHVIQNGNARIDFPIVGAITINTDVEVFDEYDFKGNSFCLARGVCATESVCYFDNISNYETPWDVSSVKSVRIGC